MMHLETIFFLIKLLCALVVVFGCCYLGLQKVDEQKLRMETLVEFNRLSLFLKNEIRYLALPLPEAIGMLKNQCEGIYQVFFEKIEKGLSEKEDMILETMWEWYLKECFSSNHLTETDFQILNDLGSQLGELDKEHQMASIDWNIERLEEQINHIKTQIPIQKKIYQSIGTFAGMLIVIILF